jgi:hypothetical protein
MAPRERADPDGPDGVGYFRDPTHGAATAIRHYTAAMKYYYEDNLEGALAAALDCTS